jgi:hypothetical protein
VSVARNGTDLAKRIAAIEPEEVYLVCHSRGGLVGRNAELPS